MCVLSVAGLHSCRQRPEVKPQATQTPNGAIPDIQRVGAAVDLSKTDWINAADKSTGFLIVKNDSVLRSLAVALRNKTPEERKAWATQYGFLSMQQVYETAAQAGEKQQEFLEKFPNALRQDPQAGLLPNIHDYDLAHLVNPDGLIMVAGHLFQYNCEKIKIVDAKKNKLNLNKINSNIFSERKDLNVAIYSIINKGNNYNDLTPNSNLLATLIATVNINPGPPSDIALKSARALAQAEVFETVYPKYGDEVITECTGTCSFVEEGVPTPPSGQVIYIPDPTIPYCICYYYQPIIGFEKEIIVNTLFFTELNVVFVNGELQQFNWGLGHRKTIVGNVFLGGVTHPIHVGPIENSAILRNSFRFVGSGNATLQLGIQFQNFYSGSLDLNRPNIERQTNIDLIF